MQAAFIAFSLGLLAILLLNLIAGSPVPALEDLRRAPRWTWLGGIIGAAMVLLSIMAIPRIGVGAFMASVICGQLVAAMLFDHFGAFGLPAYPVNMSKLLGAGLLVSGVWLMVFR